MERLINKLYEDIIDVTQKWNRKNINELGFKIGETISNFYADNKEVFKKKSEIIEKEISEFYRNYQLKEDQIKTDKYKKSAPWDKIKTALSDALKTDSIGVGFSTTNLGLMQQFYRKYRNTPDSLELAYQLDWSHNVELIKDKLNEDERKYYLKNAVDKKWTVKELQRQINEETYDYFLRVLEESNYKFKINRLEINNYKSLVGIELLNPSPLLVFAGANATGKSSIFEAIEFLMHSSMTTGKIALDIFGGPEKIVNFNAQKQNNEKADLTIKLGLEFESNENKEIMDFGLNYEFGTEKIQKVFTDITALDTRIVESFSRIYIDNYKRAENKLKLYNKLRFDASNLNKILKTILEDKAKRDDIIEWMQVLIPGVESIKIAENLGREELQIIEKAFPDKPITGSLISEGTFNIIALLAVFYQSDKQQFICIEEPETGLNPAILQEMVPFFREMIKKYGHHIWVTTHSVSLVAQLNEEELVIVNKKEGKTNVYPCKEGDFEELRGDEAWMNKMLKGGGLPW
ncbi:MAG: AAA family ATPase [Prolixibacteraceae bacterium]|nr:AAA family ATPase [Prolixibacteraceae bacterium]